MPQNIWTKLPKKGEFRKKPAPRNLEELDHDVISGGDQQRFGDRRSRVRKRQESWRL